MATWRTGSAHFIRHAYYGPLADHAFSLSTARLDICRPYPVYFCWHVGGSQRSLSVEDLRNRIQDINLSSMQYHPHRLHPTCTRTVMHQVVSTSYHVTRTKEPRSEADLFITDHQQSMRIDRPLVEDKVEGRQLRSHPSTQTYSSPIVCSNYS